MVPLCRWSSINVSKPSIFSAWKSKASTGFPARLHMCQGSELCSTMVRNSIHVTRNVLKALFTEIHSRCIESRFPQPGKLLPRRQQRCGLAEAVLPRPARPAADGRTLCRVHRCCSYVSLLFKSFLALSACRRPLNHSLKPRCRR